MGKSRYILNSAKRLFRSKTKSKSDTNHTLFHEHIASFEFKVFGPVKKTRIVHTWRFSCFENFEHNVFGITEDGGLFLALGDAGCFTHMLVSDHDKPLIYRDNYHRINVFFCNDTVELWLDGTSVKKVTLEEIKVKPMRVFVTPPVSLFGRIFGPLCEHHSYVVSGFPIACLNPYWTKDVEVVHANCK